MRHRFQHEFDCWQRYTKSAIHERGLPRHRVAAQWEKRIMANPYILRAEEYLLLREANFPFAYLDAHWMDRYLDLWRYRQKHGHCLVPASASKSGPLGMWVCGQRLYRHKGALSLWRQRALNRLGFCWDVKKLFWQQRLAELTAFVHKHGHMRVPEQEPYVQLAHWISNVRASWRKLTPAQRRQLNKVGFVWKSFPLRWKNSLHELKAFVRERGHADVPHVCPQYPKAAAMVEHQRRLYRAGTIDPAKRRQLEALGVRWNILNEVWEQRYRELCKVHRRLGHVRLPKGWPENKRLERWLRSQRENWRRLSPGYRGRLKALGVRS